MSIFDGLFAFWRAPKVRSRTIVEADVIEAAKPKPVEEPYTGQWGIEIIVLETGADGYAKVKGGGRFIWQVFDTRKECRAKIEPTQWLMVPNTPQYFENEAQRKALDVEICAAMRERGYADSCVYGISMVKVENGEAKR